MGPIDGLKSIFVDRERLEKRIRSLEQNHRNEIARREDRHAQILRQANEKHAQKVFRMEDSHTRKVTDLKRSLADKDHDIEELTIIHTHDIDQKTLQIKAIEKDREDRIAALEYNHAMRVGNLEQESADKSARYENYIKTTIQKHEGELVRLHQAHQNELTTLRAQHDATANSLLSEVRGLENVLRTRDNNLFLASMLSDADTKQDPDEHIRDKFLEVEKMVEDLSILAWKPDQRIWTDQLLQLLGGNQNPRLLKKRILQDNIWSLLHQYIFCSPFRMFGKEGQILEDEWNRHSGEDPQFDNGRFIWPPLGIEAERWRYVTIRECRKALMEALPSRVDPRAKIKEGFRHTKIKLNEELKSMLDTMVQYTEADAKSAEDLVMLFANVWLEFGMHRCRFILSTGSSVLLSVSEKARQAEEGNLELTIVPGLRRHGDLRGIELAGSTVIGDFEGDFLRFS